MSGHTPGPWTARVLLSAGRHTIDVLESKSRRGSAGEERATVVAWPGFDSCDQPVHRTVANARLIASAPDLAERVRQTCLRIEWLREAYAKLVESMPGKFPHDHPVFAVGRAVEALSLQAELGSADLAAAEGRT